MNWIGPIETNTKNLIRIDECCGYVAFQYVKDASIPKECEVNFMVQALDSFADWLKYFQDKQSWYHRSDTNCEYK